MEKAKQHISVIDKFKKAILPYIKDEDRIFYIIKSFKSEEDKIECLPNLNNEDYIFKVTKSFKSEKNKIKALPYLKYATDIFLIIDSFKLEKNKIRALPYLKYANDIFLIIDSFKLEKNKIRALPYLTRDDLKAKVILDFKLEESKVMALPYLTRDDLKAKFILDFKLEENKVMALQYLITDKAKALIIRSCSSETIMKYIEPLIERKTGKKGEELERMISIIKKMYEKNHDVVKTIDMKMLEAKYLDTLGLDKINLISCYPEIQSKILGLDDKKLRIFTKCIAYYVSKTKTEDWTPLASLILDSLISTDFDTLIGTINDDLNLQQIEMLTKILQSKNVFEIKTVENLDLERYKGIKKEKTDEWIKSDDIENIKLAVLEHIFGHDINYAKELLKKYGESIKNLPESDVLYYLKSLQAIMDCKFAEDLEKMYSECNETTFINKVFIERQLKTEFGKLYNEGLLKVEGLKQVTEDELSQLDLPNYKKTDNISPMYWAGTDFKMIIHSVGAYRDNTYMSENYKEDWNRPLLASQHFCTCYIRNDMMSMASIKDICYGFNNMSEDSLILSSNKDMFSSDRLRFTGLFG